MFNILSASLKIKIPPPLQLADKIKDIKVFLTNLIIH